jgi:hypothetical protein
VAEAAVAEEEEAEAVAVEEAAAEEEEEAEEEVEEADVDDLPSLLTLSNTLEYISCKGRMMLFSLRVLRLGKALMERNE